MTLEPALSLLQIQFPHDVRVNIMMFLRWIHFLGGITWIGLLYFFNLVNFPFIQGLEGSTRSRIYGPLMSRSLWWFRWSAVVTVVAGFGYWNMIVAADASNAGMSGGRAIWSFLVFWTLAFMIEMGVMMSPAKALRKGPVLAGITAVLIFLTAWAFVYVNSTGWESNRLLCIGVGGGIGWFMMFNVWGLVWRMQKRMIGWMEQNALNGAPLPEKAAQYAHLTFLASRLNFWLSFPMLFFMGAASHYTMFTGIR